MLPAVDATALSAVMAALEEAKGFLARRCRADRSGAIRLNRFVSTIGLDSGRSEEPNEADARHAETRTRTATLRRVKPLAWGRATHV